MAEDYNNCSNPHTTVPVFQQNASYEDSSNCKDKELDLFEPLAKSSRRVDPINQVRETFAHYLPRTFKDNRLLITSTVTTPGEVQRPEQA